MHHHGHPHSPGNRPLQAPSEEFARTGPAAEECVAARQLEEEREDLDFFFFSCHSLAVPRARTPRVLEEGFLYIFSRGKKRGRHGLSARHHDSLLVPKHRKSVALAENAPKLAALQLAAGLVRRRPIVFAVEKGGPHEVASFLEGLEDDEMNARESFERLRFPGGKPRSGVVERRTESRMTSNRFRARKRLPWMKSTRKLCRTLSALRSRHRVSIGME
mmetsp:Transcript_2442/g.6525  ORF Transcript_2442/g.6525 Transcript_2442/m.6525 type:complete len:218 (+) Transcript_2442:1822-2475(+)